MFHPDLRLLRSFVAVAEECSVTRAAEKLHLTQPTVSGQIKELEQALGFMLFHRTTRNIVLSTHGQKLLPFARSVIAETQALREQVELMQHADRSRFRLGAALYTMDFPERLALLEAFQDALPDIDYVIDNRLQSAQIPDLVSERLDASLLLGIAAPMREDNAARNDGLIVNEVQYPDHLKRVVLRRQRIGLLVPKASPLAAMGATLPRSALEGQTIAMLSAEHGDALTRPIERFFGESGAKVVVPAEGNALAVERHAERHGICGIGIGWFPILPGLEFREVEEMDFFLDFALVLGGAPNPAAQRFFDFAANWQAKRQQAASALAA